MLWAYLIKNPLNSISYPFIFLCQKIICHGIIAFLLYIQNERIKMPNFTPEQQDYLSHMYTDVYSRLLLKKVFVEACLYMEGQKLTIKKAIANYYARLIVASTFHSLITDNIHAFSSIKLDSSKQPFLDFFEKNILLTEQKQTTHFKKMLLDLTLEGHPVLISSYYDNLSLLKKKLSLPFKDQYSQVAKNELIDQYKSLSCHNKKNLQKLSLINVFFLVVLTDFFLNSMNEEYPKTNGVLSIMFGLMCHFYEWYRLLNAYNKIYDERFSVVYKTKSSSQMKSSLKNTADLTQVLSMESPEAQLAFSPKDVSLSIDDYEISVIPRSVSLFPENQKAPVKNKETKPSKPIFPPIEEKKEESALSANFFGPAFNSDTQSDNFVKLQANYLGQDSQLYGIWYISDEKSDDTVSDIHSVFKERTIGTEGRCIKQISLPGFEGNYFEIRGNNAGRVFGKEFITKEGKTAILFPYFHADGLHRGANLNRRIVEHLDTAILQIHEINTTMSSLSSSRSPRLGR